MSGAKASTRRRGEPLVALALLLAGWTGARMFLWESPFPSPFAPAAAAARLADAQLVIAREWGDPQARLNGALQLSKGLAKAAG